MRLPRGMVVGPCMEYEQSSQVRRSVYMRPRVPCACTNPRLCQQKLWFVANDSSGHVQELSFLLRFSFRFSLSTRLACIFAAICSYLSRSAFFSRLSLIAAIRVYTKSVSC